MAHLISFFLSYCAQLSGMCARRAWVVWKEEEWDIGLAQKLGCFGTPHPRQPVDAGTRCREVPPGTYDIQLVATGHLTGALADACTTIEAPQGCWRRARRSLTVS